MPTPIYTPVLGNRIPNGFSEHLTLIYQQYPGVPDPYPLTWHRSDTELPLDSEWHEMLNATASALRQAANICEQISSRSERTTCNGLLHDKNALLCAIHKTEALVAELSAHYPWPEHSNYRIASANPDIASLIPTLLYNSDDRILIWMPRLPSKRRGTDSLLFHELRELLADNKFNHMDEWHSDFCHVYHPDNLTGILDVDNYCYKPVIDALTLALASQDCYTHFSYSMYNIPHPVLKPGCYIHICKREERIDFFQDIISLVQTTRLG